MWIVFLENYGGSTPIPSLNPPQLEVFSDASANVALGRVHGVVPSGFGEDGIRPFSMFTTLPLTFLNCTQL